MHILLSVFFGLLSVCVASSQLTSPFNLPWPQSNANSYLDIHPWIPAVLVLNASRSPCPMLNTLANHGFLPRDGQNITRDDFNNAQVSALNFDEDLASTTTNAMVAKLGSPKNSSTLFNLADFASHNHTEHDASLTRLDIIQGSTVDVQPSMVEMLLNDSSLPWLNTSSIGYSRVRREAESISIGSPMLSDAFTSFAQLEASFILVVFGVGDSNNTDARGAPKGQVREWLNNERFPSAEGYVRSESVLTLQLQQDLISGIKKFHDQYADSL